MKRAAKRLTIRTETIRKLERAELEHAVGGDSGDFGCPLKALVVLPAPPRHGG